MTPKEVRKRISLEHPEYMEQCVSEGHGVLIVTAHFGNWEIGGAVLAALGHKVNALVLPERLQKLNRMFQRQREKRGINLIPVGKGSAVFSIVKHLRKGEVVAVLGDRDFTGKDDRIDFFGKPARIPRGPAWLCKKAKTPIVPGLLMRQVDDSFLLRFYPPIYPGAEESVESIQKKICRFLGKEISERPYQWFIFDDFWDEGPPTETAADRVLS